MKRNNALSFRLGGAQIALANLEVANGKRPWKAVLVSMVATSIALGASYAVLSHMSRNLRPNLEKFQITKLTDSGRVELVSISPDGRYVSYSMRETGGSGLWLHQVATHIDIPVLSADAV